ncbi:MAG: sel1 repeat family protein [Lachnospiraceae bacterium]|nr:sel1 repeat family protein [Lachnospiraceae bacterium]
MENRKSKEYYDPFREMSYYKLDCPTEEEQFRFVEAMEYLIETAVFEDDVIAFSYNLAMYYRDIKDFRLERKYLEKGEELGSSICGEELGIIWYYGLGVEPDYEKAFHYFDENGSRLGKIMLSDMYKNGQYVRKNTEKCRKTLEKLMQDVECEKEDEHFYISTKFPEIAVRLTNLNIEEGCYTDNDFDNLLYARMILSIRQSVRPFWGNIILMKRILETIVLITGKNYDIIDLYDLLVFDLNKAIVFFEYNGIQGNLDIFDDGKETIFQYEGKWFHGPEDFLEKARFDGKRITTVLTKMKNVGIDLLS